MSGATKGNSLGASALLQPTYVKNSLGVHIVITCGNVTGQLYVAKLSQSKRVQAKCILVNGSWLTPSEVEALAGKRGRKWRQSLLHLDKPLSGHVVQMVLVARPGVAALVSCQPQCLLFLKVLFCPVDRINPCLLVVKIPQRLYPIVVCCHPTRLFKLPAPYR